MDENALEGSVVLEKMAKINKVDEFFDAIDADDFKRVRSLLVQAGVDAETISQVINEMREG